MQGVYLLVISVLVIMVAPSEGDNLLKTGRMDNWDKLSPEQVEQCRNCTKHTKEGYNTFTLTPQRAYKKYTFRCLTDDELLAHDFIVFYHYVIDGGDCDIPFVPRLYNAFNIDPWQRPGEMPLREYFCNEEDKGSYINSHVHYYLFNGLSRGLGGH